MSTKIIIQLWKGRCLLCLLFLEKKITELLKVKRFHRRHLRYFIKKTGLFDSEYYLEVNSDISEQKFSALQHYVIRGDQEGRNPMPIFDPRYYRSHTKAKLIEVNALLHYVYIGRYLRLSPSPWFDVDYYLNENKDVARSGIEPLKHYLTWGGLEGRSPCQQFNSLYYLETNPEVVKAKNNPLLHYLAYGRLEEKRIVPEQFTSAFSVQKSRQKIERMSLPDDSLWQLLIHIPHHGEKVDVIVPVYKGYTETLSCLYSVLSVANKTAFELIVIDDATPDKALAKKLQELAQLNLFTLLINDENEGFVKTVNRGMKYHSLRDVVLLNSDTEVYDGWLDRLKQASKRHPQTGTVTPLSNNATICSYPHFLHDNPYPLELDYKELNKIAGMVNASEEVIAPTAVGFCMYIKRSCLNKVGLFDAVAFGKGYGEENDFCQRAIQKNWINIIAPNVFVRHWGATSFQGEKSERIHVALAIVNQRYPNYQGDVEKFIKQDELQPFRQRLDWARMKRFVKSKNVLIICHNRGGGAERSVQENIQRLNQVGYGTFLMRPAKGNKEQFVLSHPFIHRLFNCLPISLLNIDKVAFLLKELKITVIHVHSLVDFISNASDIILNIAEKLAIDIEVYVHDYKAICPRINLIDEKGLYCNEPDELECNRCLKARGSSFDVFDIKAWRAMRGLLLKRANKVMVPDRDVKERLEKYFANIQFTIAPHDKISLKRTNNKFRLLKEHKKLRIVVIGGIGKMKGYDILSACAEDAKKRKLPLEFVLMGYSLNDKNLQKLNVNITGRYLEEDARTNLENLKGDIVWLPSLWPETYSYTLSLALEEACPVFAFDLGAIATRLREIEAGSYLMPLQMVKTPHIINDRFISYLENCQLLSKIHS